MKQKTWLFLFFVFCLFMAPLPSSADNDAELPKSLNHIGEEAFSGTGFSAISIPKTTIEIGYGAFANGADLISIKFPEGSTIITENGVVYNRCALTAQDPGRRIENLLYYGEPRQAALIPEPAGNHDTPSYSDERSALQDEEVQGNGVDICRARKKDEGSTLRPQERAEIHPIDCDFP